MLKCSQIFGLHRNRYLLPIRESPGHEQEGERTGRAASLHTLESNDGIHSRVQPLQNTAVSTHCTLDQIGPQQAGVCIILEAYNLWSVVSSAIAWRFIPILRPSSRQPHGQLERE